MRDEDFNAPAVLQPYDQESWATPCGDAPCGLVALDEDGANVGGRDIAYCVILEECLGVRNKALCLDARKPRPRLNVQRAAAYALAILTLFTSVWTFRALPLMQDKTAIAVACMAAIELVAVACGLLTVLYEGGKP